MKRRIISRVLQNAILLKLNKNDKYSHILEELCDILDESGIDNCYTTSAGHDAIMIDGIIYDIDIMASNWAHDRKVYLSDYVDSVIRKRR